MDGLRYGLAIDVRADSLEFQGRLTISARALPARLELDSVGLAVQSVTRGQLPIAFQVESEKGRLILPEIPAGAADVVIEYSGKIDDAGVRGFHVSPMGTGRLYTTYFEPNGARRLLPCLDRPDAKAVFAVELTVPPVAVAISNMPVDTSESLPDGRRRVRFAPTPMSTYLLYVGIGPVEELAGNGSHPRVIVGTPPGRSSAGRFSLDVGERAIEYFNDYYAEPYPLPKLHLLAIPQFGSGAMENWGAIAFQEYLLLHDDRSTASARMRSVEVICHEIAHQWFGNLVTMRWWNDLWLNESFASFVAIQAQAALFPDWGAWDDFLSGEYAGSMLWDALPHTHPIRVEVQDPNQIRQIFDEISYGKGSSVLRMAEAYVGEPAFRRGVSQYLADHRWGNAQSEDLWKAVAGASEPAVERLFTEWVGRGGFPVVRARLDGRALTLEQRRFSLLEPVPDTPWPIPLQIRDGSAVHRRLFDSAHITVEVGGPCPVINPGRTGFYRVQYEGVLRDRLLPTFAELPPIDRWGLLNDARALFLAGVNSLDEYLSLLGRVAAETDPFVVGEVIDSFRTLFPVVHRVPRWESALREIVTAQSSRLGLDAHDGEPDRERALREQVQFARVRLDPAFASRLAEMFPRRDALSPELVRPVMLAYALTAGPSIDRPAASGVGQTRYLLDVDPECAYLINPGSVGQPRDGDPRAAYVLYDADNEILFYHRVAYDIETTQRKIREAGLPEILAARLMVGK